MFCNAAACTPLPTLRARLNLLLILAFLPVAAVILGDAVLSRARAMDGARQQALEEAAAAATDQAREFAAVRGLLAAIAASVEETPREGHDCAARLEALLGKLGRFSGMGALDAAGNPVCLAPAAQGQAPVMRPHLQEETRSGGMVVSAGRHRVTGKSIIVYSYPLKDGNGGPAGMLFAVSRSATMAMQQTRRAGRSRVTYFDRHGAQLAQMEHGQAAGMLSAREMMQASGAATAREVHDTDGVAHIAAVAAVRGADGQALAFVRAGLDREDVLATWRDTLVRQCGGLAVALLCGALLARVLIERWLAADLRALVRYTGALREGRAALLEARGSSRESREALQAVAAMAGTLAEQRNALHAQHVNATALNIELEQRVQQRTAALERSELLYRYLAESIPQIVWCATPGEGITYVNRTWQHVLGGPQTPAIGHAWVDFFHPDERETVLRQWQECVAQNKGFHGQYNLRCRDGQYRYYLLRSAPIAAAGGSTCMWAGVGTDISELKQTETALRSANAELESFSYSVSHDLRAPLNAIHGYIELLQEDYGPVLGESGRHYLERINAGSRRMSHLIDDLLKLAKLSAAGLRVAETDLSAICLEVAAQLREAAPERMAEISIQPGMLARGDARLLRIVMENLLSNAWKFTAGRAHSRIEVGCSTAAGMAGTEFHVRDNGVGFDMRHAGKLFGVFQRLHSVNEFPGSGIGLATVRRVIERHGGRIWANAREGEGAVFSFTLGGGNHAGNDNLMGNGQ